MLQMAYGFLFSLIAATQAPAPIPPVDPAAPHAVNVTIEATLPDGAPAAEIPVDDVGLERGCIRYGEIDSLRYFKCLLL